MTDVDSAPNAYQESLFIYKATQNPRSQPHQDQNALSTWCCVKAGVHGVRGGEAMIRFPDDTLRYLTVRESARVQSFPDDARWRVRHGGYRNDSRSC